MFYTCAADAVLKYHNSCIFDLSNYQTNVTSDAIRSLFLSNIKHMYCRYHTIVNNSCSLVSYTRWYECITVRLTSLITKKCHLRFLLLLLNTF